MANRLLDALLPRVADIDDALQTVGQADDDIRSRHAAAIRELQLAQMRYDADPVSDAAWYALLAAQARVTEIEDEILDAKTRARRKAAQKWARAAGEVAGHAQGPHA